MAVITFGSLALLALLGAARAMPGRSALERALAASVVWIASAIAIVESLSVFHAIAAWPFTLSCAACGALASALAGRPAWELLRSDVRALATVVRTVPRAPSLLAVLGVACISLLLPIVAGVLLVPWSWDGLGLHLPLVNDALAERTLRWVPSPGDGVSARPRLCDVLFVAVRLPFVDDAFVDLGQIPFVLPAVLAVALLSRMAGTPTRRALPLATLVLAMPVVALDLAQVDVAVALAALVLSGFALASVPAPTRATMLASGLGLGLALGTDAAAVPLVVAGLALLLERARREERLGEGMLAAALTVAVGGWKYIENLARTGRPWFPARAALGPVVASSDDGIARWLSPWPLDDAADLHAFGFGPLFTFALAPLVTAVVLFGWRSPRLRARLAPVAAPLALLGIAGLASGGAATGLVSADTLAARNTIVVAAAALALAIAATELASPTWRPLAHVVAGTLAVVGIFAASPAFTANGPPLFAFLGRSRAAREALVGVDPFEGAWRDARERLGAGEGFGHDESYALGGRLMPSDGRGRVVYLVTPSPDPDALAVWARTERLRMVVLGEDTGGAAAARARPAYFTEAFACPREDERCAVFEVDLEALEEHTAGASP